MHSSLENFDSGIFSSQELINSDINTTVLSYRAYIEQAFHYLTEQMVGFMSQYLKSLNNKLNSEIFGTVIYLILVVARDFGYFNRRRIRSLKLVTESLALILMQCYLESQFLKNEIFG